MRVMVRGIMKNKLKRVLKRAIILAGGAKKVGKSLGISGSAVRQWSQCPALRVVEVEKLTGGQVKRHELRPDIFDEPTESEVA